MSGWIKLHRKFLDWEWKQDPNMVSLFLYLLLEANHEQKRWKGIIVERGQLVAGRNRLSQSTGISVRSIRTCLERLKSTKEITIKSTNKYSIITLCNYNKYQTSKIAIDQQSDQQNDKQTTSNRPATDHKQEVKEVKEVKKTTSAGNEDEAILVDGFERFWDAYPRKMKKQDAIKAWQKLGPKNGLVEKILLAITVQRKWPDWTKEDGRYIPYPTTWLNQKKWEEEITIGDQPHEDQMTERMRRAGFLPGRMKDDND